MPQRYVWWDDIDKLERSRVELRMPTPIVDLLDEIAKKNDVSRNALVTGILAYAVDADRRRRLSIEVVPSVRVTEGGTASGTWEVPVENTSPGPRPISKPT